MFLRRGKFLKKRKTWEQQAGVDTFFFVTMLIFRLLFPKNVEFWLGFTLDGVVSTTKILLLWIARALEICDRGFIFC